MRRSLRKLRRTHLQACLLGLRQAVNAAFEVRGTVVLDGVWLRDGWWTDGSALQPWRPSQLVDAPVEVEVAGRSRARHLCCLRATLC
jgi:hypothetical protein